MATACRDEIHVKMHSVGKCVNTIGGIEAESCL